MDAIALGFVLRICLPLPRLTQDERLPAMTTEQNIGINICQWCLINNKQRILMCLFGGDLLLVALTASASGIMFANYSHDRSIKILSVDERELSPRALSDTYFKPDIESILSPCL